MSEIRIVILGAGPAGLGAAWQLARQNKAEVVVLEREEAVGGNAGSFEIAGIPVDYGSHRLHPACDPAILADLKGLLGDDLLNRPRHGRIRMKGRWLHFPLKPQDLALHLPVSFSAGVAVDAIKRLNPTRNNGNQAETFTGVLEKGLGQTICRDFYFPYAEKIWGLPPEQLSATQARRRVSAGSLSKVIKKTLSILPGLRAPETGRFLYPMRGFGQISESLAAAALSEGVEIRLGSPVTGVEVGDRKAVLFEQHGELRRIEADVVWSTLPIPVLARVTTPKAPAEVIDAAKNLDYRAMVLIYLVLNQDQWTPYDAHYFPGANVALTRLSEPKNYRGAGEPVGKTVLCGELPCKVGDDIWRATDQELATIVRNSLDACELSIQGDIAGIVTKRLPYAYPIYRAGYETHFDVQDKWADSLDGVLTFGRQGLFAHDNTHHALAMAYAAVDCLSPAGVFNAKKWADYRLEFTKHVVED